MAQTLTEKLNRIAALEEKHGFLGVSFQAVNNARNIYLADCVDHVIDFLQDSVQLIKNIDTIHQPEPITLDW